MIRRLLRPFWFFLALVFLIEAWLWDHLEPIVARVVAFIPLREFKYWLSQRVESLSPAMTLFVFIVPVIPLFPLKLAGLWFLAHQYWFSAVAVIIVGKLLGVGVSAFIFDVTRPKLLQMDWFRRFYEFILDIRRRASDLVAPARRRIRTWITVLKTGSSSRWMRYVQRIRNRVHSAR